MHIHLSGVAFLVRCVGLGCHVVIGVGRLIVRFHHAYAIPCFLLDVVPPTRRWGLRTNPTPTCYEPKDNYLMETYVESLTESLTQQQFPEQRFLEDVDYDDAALEEMLHNAHREHVYHSHREGFSVGQSSSSVSERTERPVVERTGRLVVESGQEPNSGNAQIRTLLDRQKEQIVAECQAEIKKHEFQAKHDRRSIQKLSETIESQQEELHRAQAEELQRRD